MNILFICTGNTCRSSMAEALAKKWLQMNAPDRADIIICSAGLAAFSGSEASPQAIEIMGERGINLTGHRARLLNRELADAADMIVTMTQAHKMQILRQYPHTEAKIFTLAEAGIDNSGYNPGAKDISDPFGQSLHVYRQCALDMEGLINGFLSKIVHKT